MQLDLEMLRSGLFANWLHWKLAKKEAAAKAQLAPVVRWLRSRRRELR